MAEIDPHESIAELAAAFPPVSACFFAIINARMAEFAKLRKSHDDLLCSAKLAVYFMDQARTSVEMRLAVSTLKEAIAKAERK